MSPNRARSLQATAIVVLAALLAAAATSRLIMISEGDRRPPPPRAATAAPAASAGPAAASGSGSAAGAPAREAGLLTSAASSTGSAGAASATPPTARAGDRPRPGGGARAPGPRPGGLAARLGAIRGVVRDPLGRPAQGAVRAWRVGGNELGAEIVEHGATLDGTGRFTLTGLVPGLYRLVVEPREQAHLEALLERVRATAGEETAVEVDLEWAAAVAGRVLAPPGPVARPRVEVLRDGKRVGTAAADEAGRFRLKGLSPGPVLLLVHGMSGSPPRRLVARLEAQATRDDATVDVHLGAPAAMRGRLMDESGAPLPGAPVFAVLSLTPPVTSHADAPYAQAVTDAEGRFTLPHLIPGRWRVEAFGDGHPRARQGLGEVEVEAGAENLEHVFRATAGADLTLQLRDRQGVPLSSWPVSGWATAGPCAPGSRCTSPAPRPSPPTAQPSRRGSPTNRRAGAWTCSRRPSSASASTGAPSCARACS